MISIVPMAKARAVLHRLINTGTIATRRNRHIQRSTRISRRLRREDMAADVNNENFSMEC